jgi:predicted Zn-dependent peptidase
MSSIKPPNLHSYLLPNKLRVIYEKSKCQTSLTHIFLLCDVGSAFENKNNRGISHFIEHMVFKGNRIHSAKELYLEFDKKGVEFNAYTTKRYTCYQLSFESKYFLDCVKILSNMLFDSFLIKSEMDKERKIIKKENLIDNIDLSKQAYIQFTSHVYQNSSFEYPVDSLRFHEVENDITHTAIEGWYKTFYQPKNMIFSIVSSLTNEECLQFIKQTKFIHMFPLKKEITLPVPKKIPFSTEIQYILEQNTSMNNTNLRIGYRIHNVYSEDKYLFDVFCQILNNVSGRFFQTLREKEGLCYRIYSEIELEEFIGYFSVQCEMENDKLMKCTTIIIEIFQNLMDSGITEEELYAAKNKLLNKQLVEETQNDTISKYNAIEILYHTKPFIPFPMKYKKRYHSVTKKIINELIQKYFIPSQLIVSVLSPNKISLVQLKKICLFHIRRF